GGQAVPPGSVARAETCGQGAVPRDCGDSSGSAKPAGRVVPGTVPSCGRRVASGGFASKDGKACSHPALLLPGRADTDSSGSSRQSTPRVPGAAIFDRRSLVAGSAAGKCRDGRI